MYWSGGECGESVRGKVENGESRSREYKNIEDIEYRKEREVT